MKASREAWAKMPNARLLDKLLDRSSGSITTEFQFPLHTVAYNALTMGTYKAGQGALMARTAARNAALDVVSNMNSYFHVVLCTDALVAWKDMRKYIAMSKQELHALRAIAAGTPTETKAAAALIYKEIVE